jgi:Cyclin M transmembrane N-terminal domain
VGICTVARYPLILNIFPVIASGVEAVGAAATSWDATAIIALKLVAVVFLVLLNGFFVASEFAIVKVRSTQLDALVARGTVAEKGRPECDAFPDDEVQLRIRQKLPER